mgnify:CR=1 FL=1
MSKVHFVGAGPGDVELITLKGYKQLSEADVVIYAGSLVNPDLLNYCKEGAEIHDSASMHLMEIIDVMEAGVNSGKDVVRLQTGDFSIYGSIREQIEEMKKRGLTVRRASALFWELLPVSGQSIPCQRFLKASSSLGWLAVRLCQIGNP